VTVSPPLKTLIVLIVAFALVAMLCSHASAQTVADVESRDNLITSQEALLNVYRCRFNIDTEIVPGGCLRGSPIRTAEQPKPFAGTPTPDEVEAREKLVIAQEALLNVYRCRFHIDTELVPGGCRNGESDPNSSLASTTTITVPAGVPVGRCADAISDGIYNWEECAWEGYWDNPDYNYSLSDKEAGELIKRIWAEVDLEGKPSTLPTTALVPAGSECATHSVIGCYRSGRHHIDRLDAFLRTLLHETAHALAVRHPSLSPCRALSDQHEYNACTHNDLFRCAADYLYMRYAGIPPAGVCGTAPELPARTRTEKPQMSNVVWQVTKMVFDRADSMWRSRAEEQAGRTEQRRQAWLADPNGNSCKRDDWYDPEPLPSWSSCKPSDCSRFYTDWAREECERQNARQLASNYVLYCDALLEEADRWDTWKGILQNEHWRLFLLRDSYSDSRLESLISDVENAVSEREKELGDKLDRQKSDCGTRLIGYPRGCPSGRAQSSNSRHCPSYTR